MQHYSAGTRQQLPAPLFEQMGHYRRSVFIEQLGWELQTTNGMELDEFDGPNAVYVCAHDGNGQVSGVARLLPTTAPYLMEKVFPELWGSAQLPHDPQIWELSRFAAATSTPVQATPTHQASAYHAEELLLSVMRTSLALGAHTLVTVSPVGMERLLRRNGYRVERAGAPIINHGLPIVSLLIDCRQVRN